jgi:hypothetical protein
MPSVLSLQHEPPQTNTRQSSQKNSGAQTTVTQSGCDERVIQDEMPRLDLGLIVAISGFCNA